MAFGWFRSKDARDRSRLIKKDRAQLEARARHFLKSYLKADENGKAQFYRVVEDVVLKCQADAGVGQPSTELEDEQVARATSAAALKILLAQENNEANSNATFITDAYATVAIAYHRAAGVYSQDKPMQELGTAAVHLYPSGEYRGVAEPAAFKGDGTILRTLAYQSLRRG